MKRIVPPLPLRSVFLATLAITDVYAAAPAGPPPGSLVDIGNHKLHIHCVGPTNSQPVVIFEAGGGGDSRDWNRVRKLLPTDVRSCAYDRAGSGWSEPGPTPRTMHQEVFELHALLQAAKIPGPYVLVGQSIGGLLNRLFVEQYGSNVVGVVLVDPTHESGMLGSLRYGGWVRLREKATGQSVPEPRLEGPPPATYNTNADYMAEEFQQIYLARKNNPQPLGDQPLMVLGAGKRPQPPGTSDEMWKQLKAERERQIRDLTELSRNSKLIIDPASTHAIHIDNPQAVAQAIEQVLKAAADGTKISQ